VLFEIAQALVGGNPVRCLEVVAELAEQGYDLSHAARDLLSILRDLVVGKVCPEPGSLLDLPDQEAQQVLGLARGANTDDLIRLHQGFAQAFDDVVRSGQPRAALEMLLVRLARRPPLLPIDDLIGRLSALERRLAGGGPLPSRERSAASRAEAPPPPRPEAPPPPAPAPRRASPDPPREPPSAPRALETKAAPLPLATRAAVSEPGPDLVAWRAIVESFMSERPELGTFLARAVPVEVGPDGIVLAFGDGEPFVAEVERELGLVSAAASRHFGATTSVRVARGTASGPTLASLDKEEEERRRRAALAKVKNHPRVAEAVEVLGARVKELKLAER
jgi:DNA polymerase-3 subunit gamma/tau